MKIINFLQKHYVNIISALVVLSVAIFACLVFNLFARGIWALPFDRRPVAIVKTTHQDTKEEKYYTLYANGDSDELREPKIAELASRDSNEIQFFSKKFSTVDIVSFNYTVDEVNSTRQFHYYDADGNHYGEFPTVSDPDLLAIEKDFFTAIEDLHKMDIHIFRDGNTLYISTFCDCGFGSSARVLYRYDLSNRKIYRIGQLDEKETTDWMYLK